jgi:DNA-binding NarL/FixJ family response regulator
MVHLARREREVTTALANGEGRKDIAHRLGITHATASVYVRTARTKFGAKTTAELMVKMERAGMFAT